jgi:hypothetical protein
MVFSGVLSDLTPAEAVALLSTLVFQEKSDVEPVLNEALAQARADLFGITMQVGPGAWLGGWGGAGAGAGAGAVMSRLSRCWMLGQWGVCGTMHCPGWALLMCVPEACMRGDDLSRRTSSMHAC